MNSLDLHRKMLEGGSFTADKIVRVNQRLKVSWREENLIFPILLMKIYNAFKIFEFWFKGN